MTCLGSHWDCEASRMLSGGSALFIRSGGFAPIAYAAVADHSRQLAGILSSGCTAVVTVPLALSFPRVFSGLESSECLRLGISVVNSVTRMSPAVRPFPQSCRRAQESFRTGDRIRRFYSALSASTGFKPAARRAGTAAAANPQRTSPTGVRAIVQGSDAMTPKRKA